MKPERLIIEMIRDRLRDAWNEYADANATQMHAGLIAARQESTEHKEEHRRTVAATNTAYIAVQNWDRVLSLALDKLYSKD